MNERKLSELQKEYRAFFLKKMSIYGAESPAELTKEKKNEFFTEIKQDWAKHKLLKKQIGEAYEKDTQTTVETPKQTYKEKVTEKTDKSVPSTVQEWPEHEYSNQLNKENKLQQTDKKAPRQELDGPPQEFAIQIIKSEPNQEQTANLRILFNPNNHFTQDDQYQYPVVKMPKQNSSLKLPRAGRSNQKGYKENDFYNQLKQNIVKIEIADNCHMVIPNFNKPYEPDIVLFDKILGLYIDIEIDEPYDGYYRYPTHFMNAEDEVKQDNIRDLFFTESGWVVIRFTEKQVHCQANECIDYIKNVLNSIYNRAFINNVKCEKEQQWDDNQCIQWQKINYREKYLGVNSDHVDPGFRDVDPPAKQAIKVRAVW